MYATCIHTCIQLSYLVAHVLAYIYIYMHTHTLIYVILTYKLAYLTSIHSIQPLQAWLDGCLLLFAGWQAVRQVGFHLCVAGSVAKTAD